MKKRAYPAALQRGTPIRSAQWKCAQGSLSPNRRFLCIVRLSSFFRPGNSLRLSRFKRGGILRWKISNGRMRSVQKKREKEFRLTLDIRGLRMYNTQL